MRVMRKSLLLACLVVVGCGSSGGSGGGAVTNQWEGEFGAVNQQSVPPPGDTGTFALTIQGGTVEGNCTNIGKGETGNVTGTITNGVVALTVDYPTSEDWTIDGTVPATANQVKGNVFVRTQEYNRTVHVYLTRFELNRQ